MNQDKRLKIIGGSITPKQAVFLWLEETLQYRNLLEYMQSNQGRSAMAAPMHRLPEQVGLAIWKAMKGRPKDEIRATVNRAIRDIAFLYYLFLQINTRVMAEQRSWSLQLAALAGTLGCLAIEDSYRDVLNRSIRTWYDEDHEKEIIRDWKDNAEKSLLELYSFQYAVTSISKRYFDGRQVLFPDLVKDLGNVVQQTEELVETFNKILAGQKEQQQTQINLDPLHQMASKDFAGHIALIVDLAKVEALVFMNETETARKVMGRYL